MPAQINPGGYASELIADRFQVFSSNVGGTFYVVDLSLNDMVVRREGNIIRFGSIEEARQFISTFTGLEASDTNMKSERKTDMTKVMTKKALIAARKAADAADKTIGKGESMSETQVKGKISAMRAKASATPAPGKVVDLKPVVKPSIKPAKATKPVAGALPNKTDGEGSGAYIRRLLKAGFVDTNAILEAVHANFAGSKAKPSDVAWNKGKLKKDEGWVPPAKAAA